VGHVLVDPDPDDRHPVVPEGLDPGVADLVPLGPAHLGEVRQQAVGRVVAEREVDEHHLPGATIGQERDHPGGGPLLGPDLGVEPEAGERPVLDLQGAAQQEQRQERVDEGPHPGRGRAPDGIGGRLDGSSVADHGGEQLDG